MKKVFVGMAILGAFTFASCKKDYHCHCMYDVAGTATEVEYDYQNISKSDAESACNTAQTSLQTTDANASCVLE